MHACSVVSLRMRLRTCPAAPGAHARDAVHLPPSIPPPPPLPPLAPPQILLGPGNIFTKQRWLKRCRLWRVVFLMSPGGYWDPSDGLALALLAQRIHASDVLHIKKGDEKQWRTLLVIASTEGAHEEAGVVMKGIAESEGALCPLTGVDPTAIEWSMPPLLKAIAKHSSREHPLNALRVWVRCCCEGGSDDGSDAEEAAMASLVLLLSGGVVFDFVQACPLSLSPSIPSASPLPPRCSDHDARGDAAPSLRRVVPAEGRGPRRLRRDHRGPGDVLAAEHLAGAPCARCSEGRADGGGGEASRSVGDAPRAHY